jgi:hypothetical protein
VYFALVFGAGFALGAIRVPFIVPRIGVRYAELLEMPFMFLAILFSARYVIGRYCLPFVASVRLSVGLLALALLITAELLFNVVVMKLSLAEYLLSRDPVSGAAFVALLGVFAAMPWLVRDSRGSRA